MFAITALIFIQIMNEMDEKGIKNIEVN